MRLGNDIKVSYFIQNEDWNFPTPTSNNMMDIFQTIPHEVHPWGDFYDENDWTLEDHGKFSLKSSYNLICNFSNQSLHWPSAIWFKGCIKKNIRFVHGCY